MRLLVLHKVLIAAAAISAALFCAYAFWRHRAGGEAGLLAVGVGAGVVALGLAAYLRYFVRRTRRDERSAQERGGG